MITDLQDLIFVPTLGDEILRGTFSSNAPPFSTICFKKKADAESFIEFCAERYPGSTYKLVEYRITKPVQE